MAWASDPIGADSHLELVPMRDKDGELIGFKLLSAFSYALIPVETAVGMATYILTTAEGRPS